MAHDVKTSIADLSLILFRNQTLIKGRSVFDRLDQDIENITYAITEGAYIFDAKALDFLYENACRYYDTPSAEFPDCENMLNSVAKEELAPMLFEI